MPRRGAARTTVLEAIAAWHADAVPTALITGPTSGIGRAFADALAAQGYDLVLVSRDEARLSETAAELMTAHGVRAEVLPADLADLDDIRRVEERIRARPVDMLVNNAGFGLNNTFPTTDIEDEQRSLDVLVGAVMRLTHAALGPMIEAGRGEIVNVASVAGFTIRGTYAAHKAWVINFSSWAGTRYRSQGIRVMALCPGFVRTEFHQRMGADMSGIEGWLWLDAEPVVRAALKDLRAGKVVSVPSIRYKVLSTLSRIAPRRIVEKAARRGRR
jgi:short-subunit dehydrogenase